MKKIVFTTLLLLTVSTALISFETYKKRTRHEDAKLKECWVDFETYDGGNDKDNDSKIELSYTVAFSSGIKRNFAFAPMQAYGRFADGSSQRVDLEPKGSATVANITDNPGTFTLNFEPRGDDTWKFHYTLRMKFDDGTLLDVKSGRFKEVSDHARQLAE